MLYGNVNNEFFETQLKLLPVPLAEALRFLKHEDLINHEPGKFDIRLADTDMILQVLDIRTQARETLRPEVHRKFIDVQFLCSGGPENAAYYNDDGSNKVNEDLLDTPRDIMFYENNNNVREGLIPLEVGTFAVYFPWDVHVPAIAVDNIEADIRKIVIKVPLSACLRVN
ncbi:MAG: YhcH/YjgK/YiaL family protein [Synergistaceae bacterium]|nr:YhcH/YjgK/YiaL family protein [Synergistaceae bacterium]MBR0203996.1 YhcH/YjgK/YiaL family protein [Synergistaceae bacterium]